MNITTKDEARTWTKVSENKRNPLRFAQNLLYPFALLRATYSTGDLRGEAERFERFRAAGVPVPQVVRSSRRVLVTSDVGESIERQFRANPARSEELARAAFGALLGLHLRKLVHGRPFLRDMTYRDGVVYFLDLEEDPTKVMPLFTAQVRDLMLMVFSTRRLGLGDVTAEVVRYLAGRDERFRTHLARQLRLLRVLSFPLSLVPGRLAGKDLRMVRGTLSLVEGALAQGGHARLRGSVAQRGT